MAQVLTGRRPRRRPVKPVHCHQRATGGVDDDEALLERMGAGVKSLKGGCGGLAGSRGFEQCKFDISVQCGEQALLPAVREASVDTVVVANGFSCKTQIEQTTERKALHLAEAMAVAREGQGRLRRPSPGFLRRAARTAGPVVAGGAAVGLAVVGAKRT